MAISAWTPDGTIGRFFTLVAQHMPPPPEGFQPPVLWGTEDHVRELFEGTGVELSFERAEVTSRATRPRSSSPSTRQAAADGGREGGARAGGEVGALRGDLLELYETTIAAGRLRLPGEYLVTKGRKS